MKNVIIFIALIGLFCGVNAIDISIGAEYGGNNATSRNALDADMNNRKSGISGGVFHDIDFGIGNTINTGNNVSIQYAINSAVKVSLVDMFDMSNSSLGIPSTDNIDLQGSLTLQDSAPKPQSRYSSSAPYYRHWNELGGDASSRNGILIEFSGMVAGFAGWFGDVETRTDGSGTAAEYRLLDSSGLYITGGILEPSTNDQSLCGDPINGTYRGCGNSTTRLIGFVNNSINLAKYLLIIVGDDDTTPGNDNGFTEHISFMGGAVSTLVNYCGDSIIQDPNFQNISEQCDDGNTNDGDGCNSTCQIECVSNSGSVCQTNSNACGIYNTGVVMCDGSCSNTIIPDLPIDYGNTCSMGTGACINVGTTSCDGSCDAAVGTPGVETCNNIDDDCDGEIDEDNVCEVCSTNSGQVCNIIGSGNSCGLYNTSTGIYNCDGSCNAILPIIPNEDLCTNTGSTCVSNSGSVCQTSSNACGIYNTGVVMCDGSCSNTIIPDLATEICNNIDDDCDGEIDEGNICDTGNNTGSTNTGSTHIGITIPGGGTYNPSPIITISTSQNIPQIYTNNESTESTIINNDIKSFVLHESANSTKLQILSLPNTGVDI